MIVLGFMNLVRIVFCLVLLVVVFLIRKWQQWDARQQQFKRRLVLARQEIELLELEGTDSCSGSVSASRSSYRLDRCQIINRHQDLHKGQCHPPPSISNRRDDDGISSMSSAVEKASHTDAELCSKSNASETSKHGVKASAYLLDVSTSQPSSDSSIRGHNLSIARSDLRDVSTRQPSSDSSIRGHNLSIARSNLRDVSTPQPSSDSSVRGHNFSIPRSNLRDVSTPQPSSGSSVRGHKYDLYNTKGLFPYDSFMKLYGSIKVEIQPFGLVNCQNSCYANAVLQCLLFTPPLTAYFVEQLHSKACVNKERCFLCEFEKLIVEAKEGKSPLSPIGIISQLSNIGCQLGRGREEDAHEFLRFVVDSMQSVCLKESGVTRACSFEEETSLVGLTFGGYLRSKIQCTKCNYKSEQEERMMDLTMEIEGDVEKLEDALRQFTRTEILDADNKYHCDRCKSYVKAKKKLTIQEAPNVLAIALKRFRVSRFGKLNKPIQFPEILNLAPYMSRTSDKAPIYQLYGVIVHLDAMNAAFSGHYVCYVKNSQNKWFKLNDSKVSPVEIEKVLSEEAYILLYARCSPRPPRCIRMRTSFDPKLEGSSHCKLFKGIFPGSISKAFKRYRPSKRSSRNSKVIPLATSTVTIRENHTQPGDSSSAKSYLFKIPLASKDFVRGLSKRQLLFQ